MFMGTLKILYGNEHISILFYRISADSYTDAHSHIFILVKGERGSYVLIFLQKVNTFKYINVKC